MNTRIELESSADKTNPLATLLKNVEKCLGIRDRDAEVSDLHCRLNKMCDHREHVPATTSDTEELYLKSIGWYGRYDALYPEHEAPAYAHRLPDFTKVPSQNMEPVHSAHDRVRLGGQSHQNLGAFSHWMQQNGVEKEEAEKERIREQNNYRFFYRALNTNTICENGLQVFISGNESINQGSSEDDERIA